MKRIFSIFLIALSLLAFASCSDSVKKENEATTYAVPVIEESTYSKEFKDGSGRVVFTVDVTVPQITGKCDPKVMEYINSEALGIFNKACEFAQSNLENASKNSKPWSKKITFETTLLDDRYACFLVNDVFSVNGDKPTLSTLCFDIRKGVPCTLADFCVNPDDPESCFEFFLTDTLSKVLQDRFHVSAYITDDVLARLDEIVDPANFYLTEKGMGFYFDKSLVDDRLSGNFKIIFTWAELMGNFEIPA